ncbi:hypothetical protein VNO78_05938 [Psophocarpus tetragonolobus]|uniref:Dirigent protein n=1 Tax=Psophocarpus tetragonolobus TaxID=3891 RepID=A0AAN9SSH6_PSOTE
MAPSFSTPMKLLSLSMLLISIIMVYEGNGELPPSVPSGATNLVFYLYDKATGNNATVAAVTGIKGKDWSYHTFGSVFVVDDPIMVGPSELSDPVGRAQGMLVVADHDGDNVNVVLSIVFDHLQYKGSTLQLQGIARQHENIREVSVVSGTGKFRFARGYALFQTEHYDPLTSHSIIQLRITVQT